MKKDSPSSEVGHHHKTEPEGEDPSRLPSEAPEKGKPRVPTTCDKQNSKQNAERLNI